MMKERLDARRPVGEPGINGATFNWIWVICSIKQHEREMTSGVPAPTRIQPTILGMSG